MIKQVVHSKGLFLIICIIFFKPEYFSDIAVMDTIFDTGKVAVCMILSFFLLCDGIRQRGFRLAKEVKLVYIYIFVLFLATIMGDNRDVYRFFYYYIPIMAFVLFLDYALHYEINHVIHYMLPVLKILVFINFIMTVLYPEGIVTANIGFLGMKNAQITIILFTIILSMVKDYLYEKKRSAETLLLIAISVVTFYLNSSTTSFIAMLILAAFILMIDITKSSMFNFRNMLILLSFFLVFQNLANYIIERYFGKVRSFGARQMLWMKTWNQITLKPIIGHGLTLSEYRNRVMNNDFANSAHNQIMEVLYEGGMILLFIFLSIVVLQYIMLMRHYKENLAKSFSTCMFALFVGMMAEVQAHHLLFFPLLLLPLYYEQICGEGIREVKKKRKVKIRWLSKKSIAWRTG